MESSRLQGQQPSLPSIGNIQRPAQSAGPVPTPSSPPAEAPPEIDTTNRDETNRYDAAPQEESIVRLPDLGGEDSSLHNCTAILERPGQGNSLEDVPLHSCPFIIDPEGPDAPPLHNCPHNIDPEGPDAPPLHSCPFEIEPSDIPQELQDAIREQLEQAEPEPAQELRDSLQELQENIKEQVNRLPISDEVLDTIREQLNQAQSSEALDNIREQLKETLPDELQDSIREQVDQGMQKLREALEQIGRSPSAPEPSPELPDVEFPDLPEAPGVFQCKAEPGDIGPVNLCAFQPGDEGDIHLCTAPVAPPLEEIISVHEKEVDR